MVSYVHTCPYFHRFPLNQFMKFINYSINQLHTHTHIYIYTPNPTTAPRKGTLYCARSPNAMPGMVENGFLWKFGTFRGTFLDFMVNSMVIVIYNSTISLWTLPELRGEYTIFRHTQGGEQFKQLFWISTIQLQHAYHAKLVPLFRGMASRSRNDMLGQRKTHSHRYLMPFVARPFLAFVHHTLSPPQLLLNSWRWRWRKIYIIIYPLVMSK